MPRRRAATSRTSKPERRSVAVQPKYRTPRLRRFPTGEAARRRYTDGGDVVRFIERYCRLTKGPEAGQPIKLRPFQREILDDLFERRPDGRRRFRVGLIGEPRKNSKSVLGTGIALQGLFADGEIGAEVYSAAGDKDQARIVFGEARKMIEADPELSSLVTLYKDAIEVVSTGSVYRVLSSEAFTKEGLAPSRVVIDEVHVQPTDELWDVLNLGSGTRTDPLVVGITTAGVMYNPNGQPTLCYRLYEHGIRVLHGEERDEFFYFRWYEPKNPNCDYRKPATWRECNPALGDFLFEDDFKSVVARTPEPEFRTKRLNQWVSGLSQWLPYGAWDKCAEPNKAIAPHSEVVLAFDGSFNGDSTALVACSLGDKPHLEVVEAWEKPEGSGNDWRVPILDVEEAIRQACKFYTVREIAADRYGWGRSLDLLEEERLPVVEYPQNPQRMAPATKRFYEATVDGLLSHSGDPRLARHVANAILKVTPRGAQLTKDAKGSARKIDLAVAAVMALDRASQPVAPDGGNQIWV